MTAAVEAGRVDSMLGAYNIAPLVFDIGGGIWPVSIRDQMIRARMIVDRAVDINPPLLGPGRRLLVIGAGVAGVTAAIRAAERGVAVIVVEQEEIPFFTQANCETRWVDPTQYDWPLDHWYHGRSTWSGTEFPLGWDAGPANFIVAQWIDLVRKYEAEHSRLLRIRTNVQGKLPPLEDLIHGDLARAYFYQSGVRSLAMEYDDFGMILTAQGLESEKCCLGTSAGFPFWKSDHLGEADFGLVSGQPSVLISGGGDGGLQDLLRVLTFNQPAKVLFMQLFEPGEPTWATAVHNIQSAEDQAQRAFALSNGDADDCDALSELELAYTRAINHLKSATAVWSRLISRLEKMVDPSAKVTFVHSCRHFARCYPLNHFLVRILLTCWNEVQGVAADQVREFGFSKTIAISGSHGHHCDGQAENCHGKDHHVRIRLAYCNETNSEVMPSREVAGSHNILILRHGFEPYVTGYPMARQRRHLLPYFFPVQRPLTWSWSV